MATGMTAPELIANRANSLEANRGAREMEKRRGPQGRLHQDPAVAACAAVRNYFNRGCLSWHDKRFGFRYFFFGVGSHNSILLPSGS